MSEPGHATGRIEILPVHGVPELRPGDDLAAALAAAAPDLRAGDVLVVTSKAVSKVEGRLVAVPTDPAGREKARQVAIEAETARVVARRGRTSIVQTRHGLVLASGGVDASNVRRDEIALLPVDPDASAAGLRSGLAAATGVDVAVVITDTVGRPWRTGLVDIAIGVAGMSALVDLRGATDSHGNELELTEVAVADEIAAAAELGKGKLTGVPAAIVRGLSVVDDGRGVRPLVRSADDDMFRLGTAEAIELGRSQALAAEAEPTAVHADTVRVLREYQPLEDDQRALKNAFLAFVEARPDATSRSCRAGHITASALIADAGSGDILLTLHARQKLWLPVGGHCEPDDPLLIATAGREAIEETGIRGLKVDPEPLRLDAHEVTCSLGVPTRHLDVCFFMSAPAGSVPVRTDESLDLKWFSPDDLPPGTPDDVQAIVDEAFSRGRLH